MKLNLALHLFKHGRMVSLILLLIMGISNSVEADMGQDRNMDKYQIATFAGGCFWCIEADFEKLPGVIEAVSGYTGGYVEDPSYKEVCSGRTEHAEAVMVRYDPSRTTYAELLKFFWRHIDPTDAGGQFADRGSQYRSAIFCHDDEQKRLAELSRVALEKSDAFDKPVVTEISQAGKFYSAEEYHQGYYKTCSIQYGAYRDGSGRDWFLGDAWDAEKVERFEEEFDRAMASSAAAGPAEDEKPDESSLRDRLTPEQYRVTQQCGTEPPFDNEFWNNKREGIYVDVVSGEPLFSSLAKYNSGSGWPSFFRPLEPGNIVEIEDRSHGMKRTEVRSAGGDSHLGHLFPDGPGPTGQRYCINSASLRFIPREELEREGYGRYIALFED